MLARAKYYCIILSLVR